MSQVLINQYLAELDRLKRVSGSRRESVLREAFKDLLKAWGRQHDLSFVPEYELDTALGKLFAIDHQAVAAIPVGQRVCVCIAEQGIALVGG